MAKFKVKYSSGDEQECEQSDCQTVEQFINCRFGSCDTSDVEVTLIDDTAVVAEAPKAKKTAK